MTPSQLRIHKSLTRAGFIQRPTIGTPIRSYHKGYVNINVGPRGRILCWIVLFPTINGRQVTTSIQLNLRPDILQSPRSFLMKKWLQFGYGKVSMNGKWELEGVVFIDIPSIVSVQEWRVSPENRGSLILCADDIVYCVQESPSLVIQQITKLEQLTEQP